MLKKTWKILEFAQEVCSCGLAGNGIVRGCEELLNKSITGCRIMQVFYRDFLCFNLPASYSLITIFLSFPNNLSCNL